MPDRIELRRGVYHDSVVLMRATSQLRRIAGIEECLVAMATPLNRSLLDDLGFDAGEVAGASTSDLVVALRAPGDEAIDAALGQLDEVLAASRRGDEAAGAMRAHATLAEAVLSSDADIAVISTPGAYAVPEAVDALLAGASVMLFSDGITIDEERRLKAIAESRDRLVMGPDCGTARIGGIGLGFCNALEPGNVGIVAASGTGAQHLACLLDARGVGVGHIIGVGGRDMSDDIGGVSTLRALRVLEADPGTTHIVVVSKQPGPQTAAKLESLTGGMHTPVTFGLLGPGRPHLTQVARDVAAARGTVFEGPRAELAGRTARGGQLVGLFSGGTLATEAATLVGAGIGEVAGLSAFDTPTPAAVAAFDRHVILDLGDDAMTAGRPHPMIDPTLRREMIEALAHRPAARVLFIDIVLGYGANDDPVGAIAASLGAFLGSHENTRVVASFVGTPRDPQGYEAGWRALVDIGCDVYESNADAAAAVSSIIDG